MEQIKVIKNSYDDIPYKSNPFSYASTQKLATIGTFFSLNTPKIENARVLEIGCSFGGNIITQAIYNENAEYIGIDLSKLQVDEGNKIIDKMELKNIKLYNLNILDFDYDKFGKFDYIICHGVYSWVPNIVKDKIMEIISKCLNENGLAMVSFNCYPGWKEQSIIRDIMLYTNKFYKDLNLYEKIERSKIVLEIIKEQLNKLYSGNNNLIKRIENVLEKNDYYLIHEYLEEINDPLYLHDFDEKLEKYGLKHLSDTSLNTSFANVYDKNISEKILQLSNKDHIVKETLIDYIKNSTFKRSVLGKIENIKTANFSEDIPLEILENFTYTYIENEEDNSIFKEVMKELKAFTLSEYREKIKKSDVYVNESSDSKKEKILSESYIYLVLLLIHQKLNFSIIKTNKVVFDENIHKVKDKFIKYYEYFAENKENPICIAGRFNELLKLNDCDALIISKFNGKNTIEDISKIIKELYLEHKINIETDYDLNDYNNLEKVVMTYIDQIKKYITYLEIFEEK